MGTDFDKVQLLVLARHSIGMQNIWFKKRGGAHTPIFSKMAFNFGKDLILMNTVDFMSSSTNTASFLQLVNVIH